MKSPFAVFISCIPSLWRPQRPQLLCQGLLTLSLAYHFLSLGLMIFTVYTRLFSDSVHIFLNGSLSNFCCGNVISLLEGH